jgi:O-antigen/teichoic acid export membrane protein
VDRPTDPSIATSHIRGSTVLLAGRFIALAMKLVSHVLIVRYLARGDYGAFAYGLAIANLGLGVAVLGLNKTIGRFAPIYEEQGDDRRLFGALILAFTTIAGLSIAIVLAYWGLHGILTNTVIQDPQAGALLVVLILMVPIWALDSNFTALFAIFAHPRAIFVRRHIVRPGLELVVVIAVVLAQLDVYSLAVGFVVAGFLGVALYTSLLIKVLREKGLIDRLRAVRPKLPAKEIFSFSLPLLSTDLVSRLRSSLTVVILEALRTTSDVAAFRAVMPLTKQNEVVAENFTYMFTPSAARLYAREDHGGLNDLYWRTAIWIAILTFPIFLVTFALAQPITVLLLGQAYADAGMITAILALGAYLNAIFGFNGLMLRVFGRVRFMVGVDLLAALIGLGAIVLLVNAAGPVGAAIGTTGLFIFQNVAYQYGLARQTTVRFFETRYGWVYVQLALVTLAILMLDRAVGAPLFVTLPAAALASLVVIRLNSRLLEVRETFPELLRLPLVGRLLG